MEIRELSLFTGRGGRLFVGGTRIFFGGGPEKIGDRPSQTDGPPLPVKMIAPLLENMTNMFPHINIPDFAWISHAQPPNDILGRRVEI